MSYADALCKGIARAPVVLTCSEGDRGRTQAMRDEEIEPEVVAAVTSMGKNDKIHQLHAVPGEVLPESFSRSCTGFLLCHTVLEVEVDQATVKKDKYLQKHPIVAYFVGGKQSPSVIPSWVDSLQKQVGDWVGASRNLGCGFFQIMSCQSTTKKILMLTPHKSQ